MKHLYLIILLTVLCFCCFEKSNDNNVYNFKANANINDIDSDIRNIVAESDFCIIFFERNDSNNRGYKIFLQQGTIWEKIDVQQGVMDEHQMRKDPGYYIARDIITRKLCHQEEAEFFLKELKALGLFELPEEEILFKNCRNRGEMDFGFIYFEIVSGNKVRRLEYSDVYECPEGKEWQNIYKIQQLFEKEWFENTLCRN